MKYDAKALSWKFFAAGGPGGQHVNKVATAAMLRVDVKTLGLADYVIEKLMYLASKEGVLVIVAKRYKSQDMNKIDAERRLAVLVEKAKIIPKKRRRTKATKSSGEQRLLGKKVRSGIKAGRGKVRED